MSADMIVVAAAVNEIPQGNQEPVQDPKQGNSAAHEKKTWICSQCGATIDWLPPKARHLHPSKIRCLKCQKAKKDTEAPAEVPPAREAPKHAAPQRRPAGAQQHRAQAPRGLTLELVELCAYRSGIAPSQVEALLTALRSSL